LKISPPRSGWNPENISGFVFVGIFGICSGEFAFAFNKLRMMLLESVGDVLEEDEAEYDVLVLRRIHVAAELVGGEPKLRLETGVSRIVVR
jgi:hypothetical protein